MQLVINQDVAATVVGVGAIGRHVALYLGAMGTPRIRLIDFDSVEPSNVASQGYGQADVGRLKVHATAEALRRLNQQIEVDTIPYRFRPGQPVGEAVFCCVDSILARAAVWRSCQDRCRFWCDGRTADDVVRVLAASDGAGRQHYETTLFPPHQAQGGTCTTRVSSYVAGIAAGLMVHQFSRWLRGLPVDCDMVLNLLAAEMAPFENHRSEV